jgi:hypothetical protein
LDHSSIGEKHITGAFTADNKIYDGNSSATVLTRSLVGAVSGDTVSLIGGTATFSDVSANEPENAVTVPHANNAGTGEFTLGGDLDEFVGVKLQRGVGTDQATAIAAFGYILGGGRTLYEYAAVVRLHKPGYTSASLVRNRLSERYGPSIAHLPAATTQASVSPLPNLSSTWVKVNVSPVTPSTIRTVLPSFGMRKSAPAAALPWTWLACSAILRIPALTLSTTVNVTSAILSSLSQLIVGWRT